MRRRRWGLGGGRARGRWPTKSEELGDGELGCEGGEAGAASGCVLDRGGEGGGMGGGGKGGGALGGGGHSGEVDPRAGGRGGVRARCRGRRRGPLPAAVARAEPMVGGGEAGEGGRDQQRCGEGVGLRAEAAAARTGDWAAVATARREAARAVAALAAVVRAGHRIGGSKGSGGKGGGRLGAVVRAGGRTFEPHLLSAADAQAACPRRTWVARSRQTLTCRF